MTVEEKLRGVRGHNLHNSKAYARPYVAYLHVESYKWTARVMVYLL